MKYLTPRSKLVLVVVGVLALMVIGRNTPKPTPPAAPQITMPSTVPVETATPRQTRPTATTVPYCDTTAYTAAYGALLDQWQRGANQSELIAAVNAITSPTGCGRVQQRLIDRLELATRTGIIATTRGEVLAAQKEMQAVISGLVQLSK
jgi:hypothetical protein